MLSCVCALLDDCAIVCFYSVFSVYFIVCAVSFEVHISYSLPRLADISLCFNFEVSDTEETVRCSSAG